MSRTAKGETGDDPTIRIRRLRRTARRKQSRAAGRPLPRHLKRERIVHDLDEAEKHCAACSQDLRRVGEETSERYEYIPAQLHRDRGRLQKIRLRLHGEDGGQAAAAD